MPPRSVIDVSSPICIGVSSSEPERRLVDVDSQRTVTDLWYEIDHELAGETSWSGRSQFPLALV
jgi:hypothetical protein